jgi:outer membrane protein assembly factor BamB
MALVISVLVTACGSDGAKKGEWRSLNMDDRNSRYQEDSRITGKNIGRLKQHWMLRTENDVTSTPVVADDHVYLADWGGVVYSVDAKTGQVNWKARLENPISSTPAVADGRVYVALSPYDTRKYPPDTGNRMVALSQEDGRVLWQATMPSSARGVWSSPIYFDGLLFVGVAAAIGQNENDPTVGGAVYAVNAKTGRVAWSRQLNGTKGGGGLWGSVAVDADRHAVIFGTANPFGEAGTRGYAYSIVSVDARTGKENWVYPGNYNIQLVGQDLDFGSAPNLFKLRVGNGKSAKDVPAVGLGSKDGWYYIIDRTNGHLIKPIPAKQAGGILGIGGYLPGDDDRAISIFLPTYKTDYDLANPDVCCGGIVALDPRAGVPRWQVDAKANVLGSVALTKGAVVFGDLKGNLYAVAPGNGRILFQQNLGASIESTPTFAHDQLFVTTSRGNPAFPPKTHPIPRTAVGLYAFGLGAGQRTATSTPPDQPSTNTTAPGAQQGTLPTNGPAQGTLRVTAAPRGTLSFAPASLSARTGIYRIDIDIAAAGHNFGFESSETRAPIVALDDAGKTVSVRAFFPHAGDYAFACFVPGHAAMRGVVHVSGPTLTLDEAVAAAGKIPSR